MNTKKLYSLIVILVVLSFAVTAVMITLMPEQVPMHYNAAGEMDRMGSRYENFIFPALAAVSGLIMIALGRSRKVSSGEEKILAATGVFMILLFNVMGIYFMYRAISYTPDASHDIERDVFKLTFIALGVLIVVIGNMMPKIRRNHVSGLRTKWSLASDEVWQKSNRFAGISAVVCGILMIILAAVLSGTAVIISEMVLLLLWAAAGVIASYKYHKKEQQRG